MYSSFYLDINFILMEVVAVCKNASSTVVSQVCKNELMRLFETDLTSLLHTFKPQYEVPVKHYVTCQNLGERSSSLILELESTERLSNFKSY